MVRLDNKEDLLLLELRRIGDKVESLDDALRLHMQEENERLSKTFVSIARLEEKVSVHQKGLGAVGAMVIALITTFLTQFVLKLWRQ